MRRTYILILLLLLQLGAAAKKVKFAVDMTGQTISVNGVHVSGDFQVAAGYPANEDPASTLLSNESGTDIYSIVVDIPAFQKYEYRFINGDQGYESEFVPDASRVGYLNNDNRWIYIDSLANDTSYAGAVLFGDQNTGAGNAPAGKFLIRFKVDMRYETGINTAGVHVAGSFAGWDPLQAHMYSFSDSVYEYIAYADAGSYEYKYYNGNSGADAETVPGICAQNGSRSIVVASDTVVSTVCFAACSACVITGLTPVSAGTSITVGPNPMNDHTLVRFNDGIAAHDVTLSDPSGRVVARFTNYQGNTLNIERHGEAAGIYFLKISSDKMQPSVIRLLFQ